MTSHLHPRHWLAAILAALTLAAALGAAPASAANPVFGYGEQRTEMFGDARWLALPLRDVRRTVEFDVPNYPAKIAELDAWMSAAQVSGSRPLLAIERSWSPGKERTKPSKGSYRTLITWLKGRYPWWNTLTPWNEANFRAQPTAKNPALAFEYWKIAKKACKGCTVTSPVILAGKGTSDKWMKAFLKVSRGKVKLWAVHVYGDNNRFTDASLKTLERSLKGKIWVTEAAGWVKFLDTGDWPYDEARAARVIGSIFKTAKKHKGRVQRWYFYQWRGDADPAARWDSGVLNVDGTERKGYAALVAGLKG